MGGKGSGRHWHYGAKETVNDCRSIDVRRWQCDGLLEPDHWFDWQWKRDCKVVANINVQVKKGYLLLLYRYRRYGGDWESIEEPVKLVTTACNYGGHRYWFLCPAVGCGRRVAILYGAGRYFACRHCYRLVYPSQREDSVNRAVRRADKIRERLDWEPGILNGPGWKPKGMHWRTFERLSWQADDNTQEALHGMLRKIGVNADEL